MKNYSENSFTDSVREFLRCKYGVEYTGRFYYYTPDEEYQDGLPATYTLEWLENNQDRPLVMMGDFNSEADFLTFVEDQITERRFWLKKVFILKRTDAEGRT
jgi:endonuclease/exonuclease/phosphatase family metal-dependent hydrolase